MRDYPKVRAAWRMVDYVVVGVANLMDRAKVGRKVSLYLTLWITFDSYRWATGFLVTYRLQPTLEAAAVLAAVLGCVSKLQQYTYDFYNRSTSQASDAPLSPIPTQFNPPMMHPGWPQVPPREC